MVFLDRIYTKSGDQGETGLGDGSRVPKTSPRIIAYGGVDELNSVIGLVRTTELDETIDAWLAQIQHELFDIGAELCMPPSEDSPSMARISESNVAQIESWIDEANESLSALTSFILPGGSASAAYLHLARTVCRRVEIGVLELAELEDVNEQTIVYLNRLSDLLFVLARRCNNNGQSDVLWVPSKTAES
ncbi:MAG: ATP:cob(I)alamin adenosyltransferase [Planctomycetaceae bacterium]|nr:ATP:cob(I)alamin adenosyltransferase [Planctomycetaceae bacterium]